MAEEPAGTTTERKPKPLPDERSGTRVVMTKDLWQIASWLRNIEWPNVGIDRTATALTAFGVALIAQGLSNVHQHAILFGLHWGYFVFGGIAVATALLLYYADRGRREAPDQTVGRVLQKMEDELWVEREPAQALRGLRWWIAQHVLGLRPPVGPAPRPDLGSTEPSPRLKTGGRS